MGVTTSKPKVLISEEEIAARVVAMGAEIRRDFGDEPILLVGVLKGAALFLSDLIRCIGGDVTFDFVAISSYGAETKSSGVVKLVKDVDASLEGKHLVVVEDIVDTGLTLKYLLKVLSAHRPKTLSVCALLDKPARRIEPVTIEYRGFEVPDEFVVGYGLDFDEKYRNLPYVGIL